MNRKQAWKNLAVLAVVLIGIVLALPTFFPVDPALHITAEDGAPLGATVADDIAATLEASRILPLALEVRDGAAYVSFASLDDQRRAGDVLAGALHAAVIAFDLEPRLPRWLDALGLEPVRLGLDLRGGVHFVYEVDLDAVAARLLDIYLADVRAALRDARIPTTTAIRGDTLVVELVRVADTGAAEDAIRSVDDPFGGAGVGTSALLRRSESNGAHALLVEIPRDAVALRQELVMEQNTAILRNRVDALGVAEPIVQRQGRTRILVQVPGVQDPAQLDRILGSTATLEWRLVDTVNDPFEAARRNRSPQSSILRFEPDGTPQLLRREVIASGEHLTNASFGYSEGQPAVLIRLNGQGARRMLDATQANLGKPLAVLMIEETRVADSRGDGEYGTQRKEEVIFVGRIDDVFSSNFRLWGGFTPTEAQDLALVLRSGALAAPVDKVRSGTVGPTLGQDNIRRGRLALIVGFLAVAAFMAAYYRVFGIIANVALLANLFLMIGVLSLLPAALTLPGMAGIVLTLGMAVDANVLIIERIREELARGSSPRASIAQGYDKAWSSIADANITTLIAGIALLAFGTGPVKGFAVTLCLGVATSMFTAVAGTRAIVDVVFGRRKAGRLAIGRRL